MTLPSASNNYSIAYGASSNSAQIPVFKNRAPTAQDSKYPLGKPWIYPASNAAYLLTSLSGNPVVASWLSLGTAGGALNSLSDGSTVVTPTAGSIEILGTAGQITSTGTNSPGAITLSLPSAITTPGSLTTTSSLSVGTTLGVTGLSTLAALTQVGAASINASGSGVTIIGTGGTGAVEIGNATGNTAVTGGMSIGTTLGVTGLTTLAALTQVGTSHINITGSGVTVIGTGGTGAVQIGNATGNTAVTGSLTASTTLTATAGAITATNGNLVLGTTGNKLVIHASTAASDSIGTSVAMTAGSVTVSTSAVTASSIIFVSINTIGGTAGAVSAPVASIVPGVSFVINSSSGSDTSTVNYWIVN
jgi:hypothetical protein